MRFDIITIFPELFRGVFDFGIIRRAAEAGLISVDVHDLRDFTYDKHRQVDDRPFGGGAGMVMKPEPLFRAVEALKAGAARIDPVKNDTPGADSSESASDDSSEPDASSSDDGQTVTLLLSPQGEMLSQSLAMELSRKQRLIMICGRYEGVDERVVEHLVDREVSIGDYVLSGGEIPAMVVVDAVTRLIPGALGHELSAELESFSRTDDWEGLLDFPQYTRPPDFRGHKVPEVLLSGHHGEIEKWRRERAVEKTRRKRPDIAGARGAVEEPPGKEILRDRKHESNE